MQQALEGRLAAFDLPPLLKRIDSVVLGCTGVLVSAVGITFAVLVGAEVVSRYVWDYSIVWVNGAATLLLVWFFLLGSSLALRQRAHIGFELAVTYLPGTFAKAAYVVSQLLMLAFFLTMFWSGYRSLGSAWRQIDGSLQISMIWVTLSIPAGFLLMIYTQLAMILETIRRREGRS